MSRTSALKGACIGVFGKDATGVCVRVRMQTLALEAAEGKGARSHTASLLQQRR